MASESRRETLTLTLGKRKTVEAEGEEKDEDDEEEAEREIEELEREVSEMGRMILDSRRTIPGRLLEAFSTHLLSQRQLLPPQIGAIASLSGPSFQVGADCKPSNGVQARSESNDGIPLADADKVMLEKLPVFRTKAANNITLMPTILQRMNACIALIGKLEQYNVSIHHVFKKKLKS
ncbi:uncharacterized protein [Typha angustifolia]|uniref:uncharacterized protein n=1 Tax=Typha angustifolia TaxID=59011 RepID=UPI003C2FCC84